MMATMMRQHLSFLVGISLLLCMAEGFVGMHRINAVTTHRIPRDEIFEIFPNNRGHPYLASSLYATVGEHATKTSSTSVGSQEIQEMASFVCVRLVQAVMTQTIVHDDDQGESMDLEALERLTSALQGNKKSKSVVDENDNDEKSVSRTAIADAPESKLDDVEETCKKIPNMAKETAPPKASYLSLETPQEEEAITSTLVDAGWDEYDNDFDVIIPFKEEETEVYPEGSVPFPRAETPTYVVSPLEVVDSNVVPLRPFSIPRKQIQKLVPGFRENRIADNSVEEDDEEDKPPELLAQLEEEKIGSFLEKQTDTIFDASKVWELHEILGIKTQIRNSEELVRRRLLQRRLKMDATKVAKRALQVEELLRRKLLQRQLEVDALSMAAVPSEAAIDSILNVEMGSREKNTSEQPDLKAHRVADELFRRRLLKKQFTYEQAAVTAAYKALQQRVRRKLLKLRLDFVGRETATSQSIEKENLQKKSDEMFQRRLLAKQFEFDYMAFETDKKKAENLFRRKLLEKKLEYEAARIQKELFQRRRSTEKVEYVAKAIEIIQNERDSPSKSFECLSTSENENADDKVIPSIAIYETSELESETIEFASERTRNALSFETETAQEKNIQIPYGEITEEVETIVRDSISVSIPNVTDEAEDTQKSNSAHRTGPRDDWVSSLPTVTQQRYSREVKISRSFEPREFNPTIWSRNNHFQTIVGTLFRKETMYSRGAIDDAGIFLDIMGVDKMSDEARRPLEEFQWDKRYRVETNDGDFFVADWKYADHKSGNDENPVCLICHGLESCSDSEIVKEIAIACNEKNIDAACLNFRGCHDNGASCNLTPRGYHLGFTDDLMQQIEEVHAKNPNRRIFLSGFSLGAGVVTRLLTKLGPKAYEYNICGAAVNAVPFDVGQNHMALNGPGFTRSVYGSRLLKSMKTRMGKQYDQGGFTFDKSRIEECETIMDFENLAICTVFGFDDAYDYYDKVKTIDKLQKICVPQYVIQARDDPFFVGLEEVANDEGNPLRVQYTDYGGHCGYVLHQREPDEKNCKTSWMPRQLARFFAHIEENREFNDSNES